jgi:hypothetical protein
MLYPYLQRAFNFPKIIASFVAVKYASDISFLTSRTASAVPSILIVATNSFAGSLLSSFFSGNFLLSFPRRFLARVPPIYHSQNLKNVVY